MNELAPMPTTQPTSEVSGFEMKPRTLKEAMDFCELMANSDLVPNAYKGKPGNIMVAIQMGQELGLSPMRALRSIAVINGRASMWGDDVLAMVLASPVCEYVNEADSTDKQGVCKTKRKGCAEQVSTFTLEDAKRAGLLGKQGPWQSHTGRMLKLRARGFGLRDTFADVLAGLVTAEEALDMPVIEPTDPATNMLEAAQPLTLKDKLKAKVETVSETVAGDGAGTDQLAKMQANTPPQQASDAPPPTFTTRKGEPAPYKLEDDSPTPFFIWKIGKDHKDESIATIPDAYLDWFSKNGKREDHVEAANIELDRRRGQGTIA